MAIFSALVMVLAAAAFAWIGVPVIARLVATARLRRLCRDRRTIVLTYDDGPSLGFSDRLMDLLASTDTKASFFVLGRNVDANRAGLDKLLGAGHEVGSHTQEHANAWKTDPLTVARDIERGRRLVASAGGSTLFRAPYGKATLATLLQAWRAGLRLCWWTIDTRDTRAPMPAEAVIAEIGRQRGGVVLMHDLDRPPPADGSKGHNDYVLETTARIIAFARENGYRVETIGAVCGGRAR